MKGFLTAKEIEILQEAHHDTRLRKQADRIKAILLLNQGFSYSDTARILMLDDETIRRYEREYQKTGVDGLLENRYLGSNAFLTVNQQQEFTQHLRAYTYQTVKEIVSYVEQTYQTKYSVEGMTQLLHRLGFVYKKTKRIPGKLDPVKQENFLKQYEQIKTTKQDQDKIYFLDATHPQHNNMPFYGWIYKGETTTIKANTGRKRLNLNGALNAEDLEVVVLDEPTINTQAMIRMFSALEEKQPRGLLYCIADNASYNHSYELRDFLKSHERIKLIYLPGYSPNLNLIERLWLFFQRKQLYNHYYETFQDFKINCLEFFQNLEQHRPELQTLLADNFQKIQP